MTWLKSVMQHYVVCDEHGVWHNAFMNRFLDAKGSVEAFQVAIPCEEMPVLQRNLYQEDWSGLGLPRMRMLTFTIRRWAGQRPVTCVICSTSDWSAPCEKA